MNLRDLLPTLSDDACNALEKAGISTVHDILLADPAALYSRVSPSLLSLRTLSSLRAKAARLNSVSAIRGDILHAHEEARENSRELCMCGVGDLDALLHGFGHHAVIEIAGGKTSGKTGLVLQVVMRHLANHPNHTAFWFDVGGEFVVERAAEILQLNPGARRESALDRLSVFTCFGVNEAHEALVDLGASLDSETDSRRTRFIVIDPLTTLFAPILTATSSQGHAVMTTFMRLLSSFARNHRLTVLITNTAVQAQGHNQFSAFQDTTTKPALGPSFTFLTDETLWLTRVESSVQGREYGADVQVLNKDAPVFVAEVFRSHSTLSQTWCAFVIRGGVSFEPFKTP